MTEETALIPRKPELVAGSEVRAIVPRNIEETMRLASGIYESGLAPSSFKNSTQVMVAILSGAEIGLAPMQAIQSIAIINGRTCLWGDGMLAIVRKEGVKVHEWMEGEGDDRVAWCRVTRPDNGEIITRSFSVVQAKKAGLWTKQNTPWITYQERMLQMRARSWAVRDGCADALRGFQIAEEVEDYEVTQLPPTSGLAAKLQAGREGGFKATAVEDALGEAELDELVAEMPKFPHASFDAVEDAAIGPPEEERPTFTLEEETVAIETIDDILEWSAEFNRTVDAWAGTRGELVDIWEQATADGHLEKLHNTSPALFAELKKVVNKKLRSLK